MRKGHLITNEAVTTVCDLAPWLFSLSSNRSNRFGDPIADIPISKFNTHHVNGPVTALIFLGVLHVLDLL